MTDFGCPGWELRAGRQLAFLDELAPYLAEVEALPYDWSNGLFGHSDAAIWYAMIRMLQPRRIIEVGCGYSTRMARLALERNGGRCQHLGIDINPDCLSREVSDSLTWFEREPVQTVPLVAFEELEAGDILFIDSSHRVERGGDVPFIILQVLPRLQPGVYVHFHDIILPEDYPDPAGDIRWVNYAEQYLLLAFLLYNAAWKILLAVRWLGEHHAEQMRKRVPFPKRTGGGSFWIRRMT